MDKLFSGALSAVCAFALLAAFSAAAPAASNHAAQRQQTAIKARDSQPSKPKVRRVVRRGDGGCQTLSGSTLEQKASPFNGTISSASNQYGVSKDLLKAVITIESCFKPKARGSSGEKGLMQLMPGTARRFNIRDGYNAWQNIHGGARYLGLLLARYDGNSHRAIAAYNAGEGNVSKSGKIPNAGYVGKVMQAYKKFSNAPAYNQPVAATQDWVKATAPRSSAALGVKPMKAILRVPVAVTQQADRPLQQGVVASNRVLPWDDLHIDKNNKTSGTYTVQTGDTVYQVMRVTGVPVRQLIRLNNLPASHGIKAGQVLRLR